ncbi:MAG: hypothetical protein JWM53_2035 [bacterium]|nr:hypothetical protein [bacterium]
MRAAILAASIAVCGCSGSGSDTVTPPPPPTGLVLALHFDHTNVMQVQLDGATMTTSRRFGPYMVAEKALPRDGTVGFVFDPSDAGMAMVCAESHDFTGQVLQSGCDNYDVVSAQVTHDSLTLYNSR